VLLTKLSQVGVRGSELSWFKDYLSNRSEVVKVNGTISDSMNINMGVQQSSVIGPLLFIIFINNIVKSTKHSKIILYADDTAIFFAHKDISTIKSTLQSEFNSLCDWFRNNDLILNIKKTKFMLFGSNKRLLKVDQASCKLLSNDTHIKKAKSSRYLGIVLDPTLSWQDHIEYIANKSSKLGLLSRIRKYI